MQLRPIAAIVVLVCLAVATTQPAHAQSTLVDRPAEIRTGTCAGLGDSVVSLANLVITEGDPLGQTGATPVEQSGTVVPYAVADFLDASHSVVVQKSAQESAVVACGEVGGALNPDGTLAVGMRAMNDSGLSGVAYFTPIDTFSNTLVTILLVDHTNTVTVDASDTSGTADTAAAAKDAGVSG